MIKTQARLVGRDELRAVMWDATVAGLNPDAAQPRAKAQPLAAHRRPTAEEQGVKPSDRRNSRGDNVTSTDRGNAASYLLRRIARDAPEVLDQIGPDKQHRSARAAAIAAGEYYLAADVEAVQAEIAGRLRERLVDQLCERIAQKMPHLLAVDLLEIRRLYLEALAPLPERP